MHDIGRNLPQDDVQAHMWLNLAASRSAGADWERMVQARDATRLRNFAGAFQSSPVFLEAA